MGSLGEGTGRASGTLQQCHPAGPRNAGLLAVEILALANEHLQRKLTTFKQRLTEKVGAKDAALQKKLAEKDV